MVHPVQGIIPTLQWSGMPARVRSPRPLTTSALGTLDLRTSGNDLLSLVLTRSHGRVLICPIVYLSRKRVSWDLTEVFDFAIAVTIPFTAWVSLMIDTRVGIRKWQPRTAQTPGFLPRSLNRLR